MDTKRKRFTDRKVNTYIVLISILFSVMILRLGWLQLVQAELYKTRALENRVRLIPIQAPRGNLMTSDGVVLATDYPTYQVSLTYTPKSKETDVVKNLVEILDDPELTEKSINELIKERSSRLYEPIIIKRNISIETVTKLESYRSELPGMSIDLAPQRTYLYNGLAGHALGFIGEISKDELGKEGYENYKLGDLLGKAGVEKEYDKYIRGKDGFRQVEVNAKNRPINEMTTVSPEAGNNIVLTLDYDLQKTMDDSFDSVLASLQKNSRSRKANAGAAVLLDIKTGKVLAMTTRPNDKIRIQNKAIQGRYIPGSTLKMITGMAALEQGINTNEKIKCSGRYWKKPYIKCTGVHGYLNYYDAIAKSCNVYFQEMGRRVTVENFSLMGKEMGLDRPTGIDLPFENLGDNPFQGLPTSEKRTQYFEWAKKVTNESHKKKIQEKEEEFNRMIAATKNEKDKEKIRKDKKNTLARLNAQWKIDLKWNSNWHEVDTFNIAIGQGRQNYTPIQLANYVATIANNGKRYKPYIVQRIVDAKGKVVKDFAPEVSAIANVSPKTLAETKKAMLRTTDPGGTASFLFNRFPPEYKVGAKTGTAQPGQGYGKGEYNGVFVAFAPANDPQIAFAGVVEYGYSGGGSAGLIAKAVFEEYFNLNKKESIEETKIPGNLRVD
ncbi:peptidoglycan glycosyltransferase [Desulfonispora thiosulfatigenes DSM 11270]|uniref:Peptidoglycan glycosyltransferase n=1 Tax=Desulfonispora thiosulfatigenes DSM 11270 TaxID=656914 RepID=A0A1W1VFS8_DESTI|nr:penicillin-binding transpeptidase domain-containing protein [Desulfonispora thiosulfatigenes]SMB92166.1 peptidoglycan glycosyltransferase [Desulfonispora thiosulfatigenes DSM 11270]